MTHRSSLTHAAQRQRADGFSDRTVDERLRVWRAFRATTGVHPRDATPGDVQRWWDSLDGHTAATRAAYLSAMRAYYETTGLPNVCEGLRRPRLPHYMPRPLTDDQLARAFTIGGDVGVWIHLAGVMGLRCVEIARLTPADVMPGQLRVQGKGGLVRFPTLPEHVERLMRGYTWPETTAADVSRIIGRTLRRAGVDATAHQLRHTAATRYLRESGYDLAGTSRFLGHASVATTMVYAATDNRREAEVLARLERQIA